VYVCAEWGEESVTISNNVPTSKELILLATNDFKNREERKGLHDQSSWVSGWITGFLSERKPNWSKVLEEKVRKDTLDEIDKFCFDTQPQDYGFEYAHPDRYDSGQRHAYECVRNKIKSMRERK
jgi:hypothetical protein